MVWIGKKRGAGLAGQRVGLTGLFTQEDVINEMIIGLEDDILNNASCDGAETPLVMDLPKLDFVRNKF